MNGDVSARTAHFAAILLGEAETPGGLAFPVQIPRAQLDYSLASLSSLQEYLERIRPFASSLDTQVYQNTLLAAGSYLGEVIRHTVEPAAAWVAPADGGMPVLQVAGETISPVAQIQLVLSDAASEDLATFATSTGLFPASADASSGAPKTADEFGFDFLDELEATAAGDDAESVSNTPAEVFDFAADELDLGADTPDEIADELGDELITDSWAAGVDTTAPAAEEAEDDIFSDWEEANGEAGGSIESFDLKAEPAASADRFASENDQEEFGFPWEEADTAPESEAASVEPFDAGDDQENDAFDFNTEPADSLTEAAGLFAEPSAEPDALEGAEANAETAWTADFDEDAFPSPETDANATSEWDELGEIVLDVEVVEEDEVETSDWQPPSVTADLNFEADDEAEAEAEINLWAGAETAAEEEAAPEAEAEPVDSDAESLGPGRSEHDFEEALFGDISEEEMADDESLLGFGVETPALEETTGDFEPPVSEIDPLVESVESTQDWEPLTEETEESTSPVIAGADAGMPSADEKRPEEWDFADFFSPTVPTPTVPTVVASGPTANAGDTPLFADALVEATAEAAQDQAFDFDQFVAEEAEAAPAATEDESEFASATPVAADAEVAATEEPLEFDTLFGEVNEDSTVIEEGSPDFSALTESDATTAAESISNETFPPAAEPPEASWLSEDVPAVEGAVSKWDFPDLEAEITPDPNPEAELAEEREFEQLAPPSKAPEAIENEVELSDSDSEEPADAWDFASLDESPELAADAFSFDFAGDEPAAANPADPIVAEEPVAEEVASEAFATFETEAEPAAVGPESDWDFGMEDEASSLASIGEADEAAAEPDSSFTPAAETMAEEADAPIWEASETAPVEATEVDSSVDSLSFDFEETPPREAEIAADDINFDFDASPAEARDSLAEELGEPLAADEQLAELTSEAMEEFGFEPSGEGAAAPEELAITETPLDEPEAVIEEPKTVSDTSAEEWDFAAVEEQFAVDELAAELAGESLREDASQETELNYEGEALAEELAVEEAFASPGLAEEAHKAVEDEAFDEEHSATVAAPPSPALAAQQERIEALLPAATKGDAEAQYALGRVYEEGMFAEDTYPEAVRRYQEAADQGHAAAQARLGHLYYLGQGVGQSWTRGVKLYLQAAKHGDHLAQCNLGLCLEHGKGVPRDMEKALRCYYAGAHAGAPACQVNLALCYLRGRGVKQNVRVAARWLAKAAEQDHGPALLLLGACHEGGVGVERNADEAAALYRRAVHASGFAFPEGSWTIRTKHGNPKAADAIDPIWWLRLAADAEEPWAQHNMGLCYRSGIGVRESASKSLPWFQAAAKANFAPAQYELGRCFETAIGAPKDMARAAKWYTRAATAGHAAAQARLALLYECGLGVERDPALAAKWGEK